MKIVDFIICDDIRVEINGKHTLVGAYGDSINFTIPKGADDIWPKALKLAFFIRVFVENNDVLPDEFSLFCSFMGNEVELSPDRIKIDAIPETKLLTFILIYNNFAFKDQGERTFKLVFYQKGEAINTLSPSYNLTVMTVK